MKVSEVLGALIVVGTVGALFQSCSGPDHSVDQYNVQATCKDIVRNQMKNPSTADFSEESQTSSSASGLVVVENNIGGKVTYNYRCSASGETVTLDAITQR